MSWLTVSLEVAPVAVTSGSTIALLTVKDPGPKTKLALAVVTWLGTVATAISIWVMLPQAFVTLQVVINATGPFIQPAIRAASKMFSPQPMPSLEEGRQTCARYLSGTDFKGWTWDGWTWTARCNLTWDAGVNFCHLHAPGTKFTGWIEKPYKFIAQCQRPN